MEGMWAGCAVVAHRSGAIPEAVTDGDSGRGGKRPPPLENALGPLAEGSGEPGSARRSRPPEYVGAVASPVLARAMIDFWRQVLSR
jgi:hypothetical protein